MQKGPLVSVVLPNYNYSTYLQKRIEGILAQTYPYLELILLDDKSTDNSVEIMRRYESHPKVSTIIVNEENSGSPFVQWEKGISLANGKYIWIAEADDEALPDFLKSCVEALQANPSASICYTSSVHIDSNNVVVPHRHKPTRTEGYSVLNGMEFARRNLYWRCYIENASGAVFRRDAYDRIQSKEWINMRSSGDWLFWSLLALEGDVIRIHTPLNRFRIHTSSVTANAKKRVRKYLEDAYIINTIEEKLQPPVSRYRHCMRTGQLYRFIRKYVDPEQKQSAISGVKAILHEPYWIRHLEALNRLLRWIPFITSMKRDALPDTYTW